MFPRVWVVEISCGVSVISSVSGSALRVALDHVVVDLHGFGVKVLAPPASLASFRVGQDITLYTSLVVREDSLTLFGFADQEACELFEIVQSVSGVGPRLALAIVSVHSPDALRRAVADEDLATLTKVPGIGKKGAQRLVLELAGKLGAPSETDQEGQLVGTAPVARTAARDEVLAALTGLGWSAKQADEALTVVDIDGSSSDVLRAALRVLGGTQ